MFVLMKISTFLINQELADLKHPHVIGLKIREQEPAGIFSRFFHNQQRVAK